MSAYRDFTSDFPSRCIEVLDHQMDWAKFRGRDVTLLLMVTSAAFLVPYERLKPESNRSPHPSGDIERFAELSKRLEELMEAKFSGSRFSPEGENSWKVAKNVPFVNGDLDGWFPPQSLNPVSKEKEVGSMLKLIRNALAHGNVFTSGNPIETLIFVQRRETDKSLNTKFEVLSVHPKDFNNFIREWVTFLRESQIPELYLVA